MRSLRLAIKRMLDMSTAHLTENDAELLTDTVEIDGPRIIITQCGWIVFVDSDQEHLPETIAKMRATGASEAFVEIYDVASKMDGDIFLINFDRDADVIEGVPTFDW